MKGTLQFQKQRDCFWLLFDFCDIGRQMPGWFIIEFIRSMYVKWYGCENWQWQETAMASIGEMEREDRWDRARALSSFYQPHHLLHTRVSACIQRCGLARAGGIEWRREKEDWLTYWMPRRGEYWIRWTERETDRRTQRKRERDSYQVRTYTSISQRKRLFFHFAAVLRVTKRNLSSRFPKWFLLKYVCMVVDLPNFELYSIVIAEIE